MMRGLEGMDEGKMVMESKCRVCSKSKGERRAEGFIYKDSGTWR